MRVQNKVVFNNAWYNNGIIAIGDLQMSMVTFYLMNSSLPNTDSDSTLSSTTTLSAQ